MNGSKIYEYDDGGIDKKYLNNYLRRAKRDQVKELPQSYTIFQCKGWMCDEEDNVYPLIDSGLSYGRRDVELLDKAYVEQLLDHAGSFLVDQILCDGSFVYGMYPRFDNEIDNYNIMRHTGTLWSLVCRYRMQPSPELKAIIDSAFDYTLTQIIYDADGNAYLYEAKSDEIKLGGNGIAIVAMTEYMDVLESDKYVDLCRSLGGGILTMLDQQTVLYQLIIVFIVQIVAADIVLYIVDADAITIMTDHERVKNSLGIFHIHGILREEISVQLSVSPNINCIQEFLYVQTICRDAHLLHTVIQFKSGHE